MINYINQMQKQMVVQQNNTLYHPQKPDSEKAIYRSCKHQIKSHNNTTMYVMVGCINAPITLVFIVYAPNHCVE